MPPRQSTRRLDVLGGYPRRLPAAQAVGLPCPSRSSRASPARTACRTTPAARRDDRSRGQNRELSGVSTSSTRRSSPVWSSKPHSNFVSARIKPAIARRVPRPSDRPPGSSIVTFPPLPCRRCRPSTSNDTFSSCPVSALVAGVKIGSIGRLSTSPLGSEMPQTDPGRAIFLPRASREVSANHALERNDPGLATPASSGRGATHDISRCQRDTGKRGRQSDQVVRHVEQVEPYTGGPVKTRPLSGMPVG